ncbi:hypothetical protein GCM10027346_18910 [Hymenobacter seoulensis]
MLTAAWRSGIAYPVKLLQHASAGNVHGKLGPETIGCHSLLSAYPGRAVIVLKATASAADSKLK